MNQQLQKHCESTLEVSSIKNEAALEVRHGFIKSEDDGNDDDIRSFTPSTCRLLNNLRDFVLVLYSARKHRSVFFFSFSASLSLHVMSSVRVI
jgi:hypothetical protein